MTRVQQALLTAALAAIAAAAVGGYTLTHRKGERERAAAEKEERRLFTFAPASVTGGEITAKGETTVFEATPDGWVIRAPRPCYADQTAVNAAVANVAGVLSRKVVTESATEKDLQQYELDNPKIRVKIALADGKKAELLVGAKNDLDQRFFVTSGEKKKIITADDTFSWAIDRDSWGFCEKRVFPLKPDEVAEVEVWKGGKLSYGLVRDGERFRLSGGGRQGMVADPGNTGKLLLLLTRDVKVEREVAPSIPAEDKAALAKLGLDPPAFEILVKSTRGKEWRAQLSKQTQPGGELPSLRMADSGRVVAVYWDFPSVLDQDVNLFRDKTIAFLDPSQADRVEMWNGDQKIELVRTSAAVDGGEDTWDMVAPVKAPVAAMKVIGVVRQVSLLRAERVEKDEATVEDLREWGLDPPQRRLRVTTRSGDVLADLRIGKAAGEGQVWIAGAGTTPRVGVATASRFDPLPKSAEDLSR